jgi:CPA1 family monovalent cation:H+ antiporter
VDEALVDRVRERYASRVRRLDASLTGQPIADPIDTLADIDREALAAERGVLIKLRDDGLINDEVLREIQTELDLDEMKLVKRL